MAPNAFLVTAQLLLASWTSQGYESAHEQSIESGRPLLVLIGAKWCGACQVMKKRVLPGLAQRGVLDEIHCAEIDLNKDARLAKRVSASTTIPCLILYKKEKDSWRRWELKGLHKGKVVEEFLKKHQAIPIAAAEKKEASPEKTAEAPNEAAKK
ncbi:MAG: thioredoxin family protein [Planctomycetales bacterium]